MRLTDTTRLTSLEGDCLGATFSPDGQWIAFSGGGVLERSDLYLIHRDGTNLTRLTESEQGGGESAYNAPHFSPDGTRLVCTHNDGRDHDFSDLYQIDLSSRAVVRLTDTRDNGSPAVSPDGQHIVFLSTRDTRYKRCSVSEIFRMTWDGREQIRLTQTAFAEGRNFVLPPSNLHPRYSSTGDFLAFSSSVHGALGEDRFEIYRMRPDGAEMRRLTHTRGSSSYSLWHPSGDYIAFISWSKLEGTRKKKTDMYLVDKEETEARCLEQSDAVNWLGSFHPNGRFLAFDSLRGNATSDIRNNWDLFVLDIKSEQVHPLTDNAVLDREPTFSPDGTTLLFRSEREGTAQLYLGHLEF